MTDLINRIYGILHYIITYTLSLGHCPQKLLTMIFGISILTFTWMHFLTFLWPSLLSYLSAMSLLCLLSLRPPALSNSRKWSGKFPSSHRPIVPSGTSKNKNWYPSEKTERPARQNSSLHLFLLGERSGNTEHLPHGG